MIVDDTDETVGRTDVVRGISYAVMGVALCFAELFVASFVIDPDRSNRLPIQFHPIALIEEPFPTVPVLYFGLCLGFACGFPRGTHSPARTAVLIAFGFGVCMTALSVFNTDPWIGRGRPRDLLSFTGITAILSMVIPTAIIVAYRMANDRRIPSPPHEPLSPEAALD